MYQTALTIIQRLHSSGFEAYLAGGCVRDILLKKEPKDYDIVTNASPEQIESLFADKSRAIGKHFGVMQVKENGHHFEIATFRSDSSYSDGRRPDFVTFTSAAEDAKRRDFTINGLFLNPFTNEIKDFVGGQIDIKERLIRFIGNAEDRIKEDYLRILRAVRFKNRLNFRFDPATFQALRSNAELCRKIAPERIRDELNKMLLHPNRIQAIQDLAELNILPIILPEIAKLKGITQPYEYHTEGDVFEHTLLALKSIKSQRNLALIWATLLHDAGKAETYQVKERIRFDSHAEHSAKIAKDILSRLHFPNSFIAEVCFLVLHHMMWVSLRDMPDSRKQHWIFGPHFANLLRLFKADASGSKPLDLSLYQEIKLIVQKIKTQYKKLPRPLLDGHIIQKELKLAPSPLIGQLLEKIYTAQIEKKVHTKQEALTFLHSLYDHLQH
ncbi:MAG: CCA tRNA nucleotidyltransferase [Candidatus Abawacabacteria bacterium]|nr:CCA tRNA nucleotidyltransferase [Candidatus Abawacabacteria bacterium]